jgi:DNA-directed RNA polymerase specialized sigma24 family protein
LTRVDYSELVDALQSGDEDKANALLSEVLPRLEEYLVVVMRAEKHTAKECVQQAFLDVFEQVRRDNIRESKYIFSYMIKASRHEYMRHIKYHHRFDYDEEAFPDMVQPEEQIQRLVDVDRQKMLEECLNELDESSRELIVYFIDKPDATTKEASKKFKLTGANLRTKKSRILHKLHHCYKRKSSE